MTYSLKLKYSGWLGVLILLGILVLADRWLLISHHWQNQWRTVFFELTSSAALNPTPFLLVNTPEQLEQTDLLSLSNHWQTKKPTAVIWFSPPRNLKTQLLAALSNQQKTVPTPESAKDTNLPEWFDRLRVPAPIAPTLADEIIPAAWQTQPKYPWWTLNAYRPQTQSTPLLSAKASELRRISYQPAQDHRLSVLLFDGEGVRANLPAQVMALARFQNEIRLDPRGSIPTPLNLPLQRDYSLWVSPGPVQLPISLADYLNSKASPDIVLIGNWQNSSMSQSQADLDPLFNKRYAFFIETYDLGILLGSITAIFWFVFSFRRSLFTSSLTTFLLLLAVWVIQWWSLKVMHCWLPTMEISLLILVAYALGLLEKHHQAPLADWRHRHQIWGNLVAEFHTSEQKFAKAWDVLQQLQPDHQTLSEAYELAQHCERKRDYPLATSIYQWLLKKQKKYRDCEEKIDRLAKVHPSNPGFSSTLVLDQTIMMPGEGLQPPTLGRYRIESVLGSGAMGVVYRGIDPAINREVAIKTLSLSQEFSGQDQETARARFFREAETAGRLNHPNIVTIYDVGEEQDLAFIAMDLLVGDALDKHVSKDTLLPPVLVYQLMVQITSGLEYAHQKGVVHRDIKPGNLIFDPNKRKVVITDFGIARLSDHSKTRTGAILGSPFFMSPEQIQGNKVDGRSDIFSLGVTFYQLLTGHLPFTGESLATVAMNITTKKHEPIRKIRSDLPSSASRMINKALQKEVNQRFQRVEEFHEALVNALKRDFKINPFQ